jgi:hypothetical protein
MESIILVISVRYERTGCLILGIVPAIEVSLAESHGSGTDDPKFIFCTTGGRFGRTRRDERPRWSICDQRAGEGYLIRPAQWSCAYETSCWREFLVVQVD